MAENMTTQQANRSNNLVPDKRQQTGNKGSGAPVDTTPPKVPPLRDLGGVCNTCTPEYFIGEVAVPGPGGSSGHYPLYGIQGGSCQIQRPEN